MGDVVPAKSPGGAVDAGGDVASGRVRLGAVGVDSFNVSVVVGVGGELEAAAFGDLVVYAPFARKFVHRVVILWLGKGSNSICVVPREVDVCT